VGDTTRFNVFALALAAGFHPMVSCCEEKNVSQEIKHINSSGSSETADSRWSWLYKLGGAAALVAVVMIPIQIIAFIVWPPPTTVGDYFAIFQNNKLIGLVNLDLLILVDNVLGIPLYLALYVALRRVSESFMAIATAFGLIAITLVFASNTSFHMLSLNDQYAAATNDAQRTMLLAAGQAMLTIYNGTAFHVNYILGGIALLIISIVMLRSTVFSKATAYVGILANIIAFGLYVPTIGIFVSIFSVVFLWIWYILISRRLLQLGRLEGKTLLQQSR
jgi:hypothetical protein